MTSNRPIKYLLVLTYPRLCEYFPFPFPFLSSTSLNAKGKVRVSCALPQLRTSPQPAHWPECLCSGRVGCVFGGNRVDTMSRQATTCIEPSVSWEPPTEFAPGSRLQLQRGGSIFNDFTQSERWERSRQISGEEQIHTTRVPKFRCRSGRGTVALVLSTINKRMSNWPSSLNSAAAVDAVPWAQR
jgi:hypothetical protein